MKKRALDTIWYEKKSHWALHFLLFPLRVLYQFSSFVQRKRIKSASPCLPTWVVGNLTLGGTGKTPLVSAISRLLSKRVSLGVLSRGYGGRCKKHPYVLSREDKASFVGDEPLLLKESLELSIPVLIDPKRIRGVNALKLLGVKLAILDDGLSHYALKPDIRLCVVDGERGFGNQAIFPQGPLRLSLSNLQKMDAIWVKLPFGEKEIRPRLLELIEQNTKAPIFSFSFTYELKDAFNQKVFDALPKNSSAFCGIGNPESFFKVLDSMGFDGSRFVFKDHHSYQGKELPKMPWIVTEKDGVKLKPWIKEAGSVFLLSQKVCLSKESQTWLLDTVEAKINKNDMSL